MIRLSVILPAHNPDRGRLARTLAGLRNQRRPTNEWELLVVDNVSEPRLGAAALDLQWHPAARIVREDSLGLTTARLCGFQEARGEICVLVDDDNVLKPDYFDRALQLAEKHPTVGIFGGKSLPEFETPPPDWMEELWPLLALRDDGDTEILAAWEHKYPEAAPIGAGMIIRREAALAWTIEIAGDARRRKLDRAGATLASGGDNDIVISAMKGGWKMGYFPELVLTHLIPPARCDPAYLARLNRAMSKSWMQLLTLHEINPWPPIPAWSVPPRQAKAWFTHHAWSGPAARVRWAGACGHFEGRMR